MRAFHRHQRRYTVFTCPLTFDRFVLCTQQMIFKSIMSKAHVTRDSITAAISEISVQRAVKS